MTIPQPEVLAVRQIEYESQTVVLFLVTLWKTIGEFKDTDCTGITCIRVPVDSQTYWRVVVDSLHHLRWLGFQVI